MAADPFEDGAGERVDQFLRSPAGVATRSGSAMGHSGDISAKGSGKRRCERPGRIRRPGRRRPHYLPGNYRFWSGSAVTVVSSAVVYFSNQLRRYSCERMKFDGLELVPCHSSLKRNMTVGTF